MCSLEWQNIKHSMMNKPSGPSLTLYQAYLYMMGILDDDSHEFVRHNLFISSNILPCTISVSDLLLLKVCYGNKILSSL